MITCWYSLFYTSKRTCIQWAFEFILYIWPTRTWTTINCSSLDDITERSINSCYPWSKVLFKRRSESEDCSAPCINFLCKARTQQADQHNSMNRINPPSRSFGMRQRPDQTTIKDEAVCIKPDERQGKRRGKWRKYPVGANDDKTDKMKTIGVYESRWEGEGMRQLVLYSHAERWKGGQGSRRRRYIDML